MKKQTALTVTLSQTLESEKVALTLWGFSRTSAPAVFKQRIAADDWSFASSDAKSEYKFSNHLVLQFLERMWNCKPFYLSKCYVGVRKNPAIKKYYGCAILIYKCTQYHFL